MVTYGCSTTSTEDRRSIGEGALVLADNELSSESGRSHDSIRSESGNGSIEDKRHCEEVKQVGLERAGVYDLDFVYGLFNHEKIKYLICDDGTVDITKDQILEFLSHEKCYILLPNHKGKRIGLSMYVPRNSILFEIHGLALPEYRGKICLRKLIECNEWIFENTECEKIMALIPVYNHPAFVLARCSGFKDEGRLEKSFLRHGKLHDQHVLGLNKGE